MRSVKRFSQFEEELNFDESPTTPETVTTLDCGCNLLGKYHCPQEDGNHHIVDENRLQ